MEEKESCWQRTVRIETAVCATGTAWGLLAGKPLWVLLAYWVFRHAFYIAGSVALIVYVPNSAIGVGTFFVLVHGYKIVRLIVNSAEEPPTSATPTTGEKEVIV